MCGLRSVGKRRHQRRDQHSTGRNAARVEGAGCRPGEARISSGGIRPRGLTPDRKSPSFMAGKTLSPCTMRVKGACSAMSRRLPGRTLENRSTSSSTGPSPGNSGSTSRVRRVNSPMAASSIRATFGSGAAPRRTCLKTSCSQRPPRLRSFHRPLSRRTSRKQVTGTSAGCSTRLPYQRHKTSRPCTAGCRATS